MTTVSAPSASDGSYSARLSPALKLACAVWLTIGMAASARTLVQPASHTVFPVFASGAHHWWNDQPLYANYAPIDYFRYPPPFALVVSPFAALGLRLGGILWAWLGLGIYALGLWRFRRDVLPADWSSTREAVFLIAATLGAIAGLWNGQSNALIVGLLLCGAAAFATGRFLVSAAWLALAVSMKLTPLPIVLLLCAVWPRRLGIRFLVVLAVIGLMPFLTRPYDVVLQHYGDFVAQQRTLASERWPGFRDAWTVWQVSQHIYSGASGPVPLKAPLDNAAYRAVQLLAALGCLVWCLALARKGLDTRLLLRRVLSIGTAWVLLFGPAVEHPTYVFLAPFLAAAIGDVRARGISRFLAVIAAGLILSGGWGALTLLLVADFPMVLIALPAGTALFTVATALAGTRRRDSSIEVEESPEIEAARLHLFRSVNAKLVPMPENARLIHNMPNGSNSLALASGPASSGSKPSSPTSLDTTDLAAESSPQ
jgi:hypothetical protein